MMKLASFDIFDTTLIRLFGRPENIDILLAGRKHTKGDALEREVESKCLIANPAVREIIRERRSDGWQIAFISDMYLDSAFLTGILRREGCYEDGDRMYISCEHNARKDTGSLYDIVREELIPDEWEHYGDNKQSDIRMAECRGIKAHLIDDSYRDLSSRFVAPAYIPYVVWVLEEAKRIGVNRLYFISRDGYILMKIAEVLPHEGIELRYFFTSRKVLRKAMDGRNERSLTMRYFIQEGLTDDRHSAMVDVGWYGESRRIINQLLAEMDAESVIFFYFGTRKSVIPEEYGRFQSFLAQGSLPYYMQLMTEHFFSASPYPTTIGYRSEGERVEPVFPDGEFYRETKITETNVEVCLQMVEAFQTVGIPASDVLAKWAHHSLESLAYSFFGVDFTPLLDLPQFDGQDFVRRLSFGEILLLALTGQHITVFDKGSLSLTVSSIRLQRLLWRCHCFTGNIRSRLYQKMR